MSKFWEIRSSDKGLLVRWSSHLKFYSEGTINYLYLPIGFALVIKMFQPDTEKALQQQDLNLAFSISHNKTKVLLVHQSCLPLEFVR